MGNLVRIDRRLISEIVIPLLQDMPQIIAAYLFGSALGECRPDSDIDIGVFIDPNLHMSEREIQILEGEVALLFRPFEGHPFDVVIVDTDSVLFAFRVIKEGVPLYIKDRDKLADIIEKVSRRYEEVGVRHLIAINDILAG